MSRRKPCNFGDVVGKVRREEKKYKENEENEEKEKEDEAELDLSGLESPS